MGRCFVAPIVNPTPSPERICLLTGGGYPYRRDALSGWCRTLVEGLRRFRFELLTVTDREPPAVPAYPLPLNVGSARAVAIGRNFKRHEQRQEQLPEQREQQYEQHEQGQEQRHERDHGGDGRNSGRPDRGHGKEKKPSRQEKRETAERARAAAALLCTGLIGESDDSERIFGDGLRQLADDTRVLPGLPLADALMDAWRTGHAEPGELPLPRLSVRDARTAATLLRHALGALTVELPDADLVHCIGGTTPLLTALAGRRRQGVPLLLTEARTPVARHKPHEERLSPAVRSILRRFRGSVARTGYAEAGLIAPLSAHHHSWALRHGAHAAKLVQVPAGVDPSEYPGAAEPESDPAVVWAGSGGPDSGLSPLLAAFEQVAAAVPGTVLHLVGVTAAHEDHCAEQIERSGLGRAVRLHPLPADPRDRYTAGHVVAHVPGPADPPYRLVEAMMSGRAVVGVDVGPAAETLGDAGVLVEPGDPAELAIAIVGLLRAPGRRRALGDAARRRALLHFTNDRVVRVYGALYADLAAPPPPPAFELALAVPAPRSEPPVTLRWLVSERTDG